MNEKNLPIRFFSMREKDERMTEGAGDSVIPNWVDKDSIPDKQKTFTGKLAGVATSLSQKASKGVFLPSVLTLHLNPNALAKGHRQNIASIFNDKGAINIVGVVGRDKVLAKVNSAQEAKRIENKIQNLRFGDKTYLGVAAIDQIDSFQPLVEEGLTEESTVKIKLINYYDRGLNELLVRSFEKECDTHGIEVVRCNYSNQLIVYKAVGVSSNQLSYLRNLEGVQSISHMPFVEFDEDSIQFAEDIEIKTPQDGVDYPVVGVLDSGIERSPHLAPWLCTEKESFFTPDESDSSHGTFVSGIIEYGDELIGRNCTGSQGCKLFDAAVFGKYYKRMSEEEAIENIRSAISHHPNIKIWNMSIGTDDTADEQEFSDYAKELDRIQDEYDVMIVKSAGNYDDFRSPVPRISIPADSIRSLVVGSIAHTKREFDLAEANCPSPFSRKGRGPAHIIKPEVVSYGGNAGIDDNGDKTQSPVLSFSPNGEITGNVGTSFSTPRITAIAASLQMKLKDTFNPLLAKALIIHSAHYPLEMKMEIGDKLRYAGFGLPAPSDMILYNDKYETTLILQDTLEKGRFIEILDFPFPQSMIENGFYYGQLTVTLVSKPILNASQGAEYCQSNLKVMMGTYDNKTQRDITKRNIKNPIGAEGRKNLLGSSLYSSRAKEDTTTPYASERMLVDYGDKFQPIKKWSVDLEELTQGKKEDHLKAPKSWYLKIEGLYRQFIEDLNESNDEAISQEFCLIITIRDNKHRHEIYDEVTQQLEVNGFVYSSVPVEQHVVVSSSSEE